METNIKIAGTTFHPLPAGKSISIVKETSLHNVPIAFVKAVLIPEPTNEYDSDAVQVVIRLTTGESFVIGYIPKADPIKTQIKEPTLATVCIKDYTQVGNLNASFVICEIGAVPENESIEMEDR